jgi:hypothetical protein
VFVFIFRNRRRKVYVVSRNSTAGNAEESSGRVSRESDIGGARNGKRNSFLEVSRCQYRSKELNDLFTRSIALA